jgi:hypothetical protein
MPIQSSSTLKNTGQRQDVDYWVWSGISPGNLAGRVALTHPNGKDTYISAFDTGISKVDAGGAIAWTRSSPSGLIYGADTDSAGNVYTVGGNTTVAKFDSNGSVIWCRSINTDSPSNVNPGISVGASGAVYVASQDSSSNPVLVKLNSDGSMSWSRKISGATGQLQFVNVDEANDRVYAAAYVGITNSQSASGFATVLLAFNLSGALQWQKRLWEDSSNRSFPSGVQSYGGSVFVSFSVGYYACPIFKYSKEGELQPIGSNIYGLWGADDFFASAPFRISQTNGDIVVTYRSGTVAKYSINGTQIWSRRFLPGSSSFYYGADVSVDYIGNVYSLVYAGSTSKCIFAKVKSDGSGTGAYGDYSYTSGTSSHYLDNSMQSWQTSSSYTISSTSHTSTAVSFTGVTSNPVGRFAPLRTR